MNIANEKAFLKLLKRMCLSQKVDEDVVFVTINNRKFKLGVCKEEVFVDFEEGGQMVYDLGDSYIVEQEKFVKGRKKRRGTMGDKRRSESRMGELFTIDKAFMAYMNGLKAEKLYNCYCLLKVHEGLRSQDDQLRRVFRENWVDRLSDNSRRIIALILDSEDEIGGRDITSIKLDMLEALNTMYQNYRANHVTNPVRRSMTLLDLTPSTTNTESYIIKPGQNDHWSNMDDIIVDPENGYALENNTLAIPGVVQIVDHENNFYIEKMYDVDISTMDMSFMFPQKNICHYTTGLYHKDHTTYLITPSKKSKSDSVAILSVQKTKSQSEFAKCILRTTEREYRYWIQGDGNFSKSVKEINPVFIQHKFAQVKKKNIREDLAEMEQILVKNYTNYKFGVIYLRDGPRTENEVYSVVETSEHFEEFLEVMADRVKLKGFSRYAGGLDTKYDSDGKHSYYTDFRGYEIMFHVANMMPIDEDDQQQILRKRYIGNDVVVIIFKEGNEPIDPNIFRSQFNHIFVIVQVVEGHELIKYKVTICSKHGVVETNPTLPDHLFDLSEEFRNFLLVKCINLERASKNLNIFGELNINNRREFISNMFSNYQK